MALEASDAAAAVIHHGVDLEQFTPRVEPQDYVCYLGRFTPGKGPLQAITAARVLGLRLLLAGPADDYYRQHVAPLVDGHQIEYVGYVVGDDLRVGRAAVCADESMRG